MFHLTDATRRQAATALFVLLCVVPTLVVLAVGLWSHLPGRSQTEQHRLAQLLGQPVEIESVRYLRPSTVLFEGLVIYDPETGCVVLQCDRLRAEHDTLITEDTQKKATRLRLSAGTVTLPEGSTQSLRPLLDRLLRRQIHAAPRRIDLTADQVLLTRQDQQFIARGLRGRATLQSQASQIELRMQLDGHETPEPIYLCAVRNRQYDPPVDGYGLGTGGVPLPCSFLAAFSPAFADLGEQAQFDGRLVTNWTGQGWEGNLQGIATNVDLLRLTADHLPRELSGLGRLQIDRARFRAGRILSAQGQFAATSGRVSRVMIGSCMKQLQLPSSFPPGGPEVLVPYDQIAFSFHLDGAGLRLSGQCESEPPGAMMVGGYNGQRLNHPDPTRGPIPTTTAVAALVAVSPDQLMLSPHAARIMQHLPPTSPAAATIASPPPATAAKVSGPVF